MLGFLDFLGHLGLLGFCCLLVRGLLRFFLVGSFGYDLATTGLAAGTSPIVLAYAGATALLATIALTIVLAYARATTLFAD